MAFVISRFAGSLDASGIPIMGYSGDEGAATSAQLSMPSGITLDSLGNLYIADSVNYLIRKVDSSGIITRIAGSLDASGIPVVGYSGDGAAATSAQLYNPSGIAIDSSGNIYIAETNNNVIRKIDSSGIISRFAGSLDASGVPVAGYSGDEGAATSAELTAPYGITLDSLGNLYIADSSNHIIRKVDSSGIITRFAGSLDASGVPIQGYSGDDGVATNAHLDNPSGVAIDSSGNLYIADTNNNLIRKVDSSGIISRFAGSGSLDASGVPVAGYSGDEGAATSAELTNPYGITLDSSGNLYICDTGNNRIRKVDSSGIITTVAGNGLTGYYGDGDISIYANLNSPSSATVDSSGYIYIADTYNSLIRKLSPAPPTPGAPANPPDFLSKTTTTIIVTADSTGEPGYPDFTAAKFYIGPDGGGWTSEDTVGTTTIENGIYTHVFTGLEPGTLYNIQWLLANPGNGPLSAIMSVTTDGGGNPVCFLRGSKILCLNEGLKEEYLPIENMKVGTLVKTLKGSYVKVQNIGKTMFNNPDNADRGPNRLFKLSTKNYPELTEDLIVTGCHSRLVDKLEPKQKARHLQLMKSLYMTTGMFRLMAFIDEKAGPYLNPGPHEIWHFALENEEEVCNYGVYANGGLLVETASIKNMRERFGLVPIE